MKIQKETVIIFITLLVGLLLISSIFISTVTLTSYAALEKQYMDKDLRQAINKIHDEEDILSSIVADWGSWDDAYNYVTGQKPDFEEINLLPETYDNLRLNLIIYTGRNGDVVYSGIYDLTNKTLQPVPAALLDRIVPAGPLADVTVPAHSTAGILMLPDNPMIIASRPVVRSDFPDEPAGRVIMGRYLDANEMQRLSALTQPSLNFVRLDDPARPRDLVFRIAGQVPSSATLVEPSGRDQVEGYALIRDVYGADALLLKITESRDIYQQGVNTTFLYLVIILVSGFFFGLAVIIILDRIVLSRLATLNHQVSSIGAGAAMDRRIILGGDDEFVGLASQINLMLDTIETTQNGLLASEEKYRSLTENMGDTLFSSDLENRITYVSPQINRYGFLAEELVGQPLDRFIHADDVDRVKKDLSREFEKGAQFTSTFRIRDKWGNIHWIEEKSSLRLDLLGQPLGIYGILRDVSDRKHAEDAIELANRKLNLMNNITRHDILNTLTGLFGLVDMAVASDNKEALSELLVQIKELGRVIQRQITFTREYQDVGVRAPVWQNIHETISHAIRDFRTSGISIVVSEENIEVFADPLLEKVFYNLMDNAIRYGEHLTAIKFSYQNADDSLILVCEDDGAGIPKGDREQIFERGIGQNTGMGLFLTREILAITGIRIRENGTYGKGARFEILIPFGTWRFVKK